MEFLTVPPKASWLLYSVCVVLPISFNDSEHS